MVEFVDGAVKAQLGTPDMRLPIRYALGESVRLASADSPLDFSRYSTLTFEQPDVKRFPCVEMGHYALSRKGNTACVINAANEVAVAAFLREQIKFTDIYRVITATLQTSSFIQSPTYDDYVASNSEARERAAEIITKLQN